jgi:uncharacterized protein (UPF0332 family)
VTPQKQNAIKKEIERGEKALKAAQLLSENGLYEDAVSRAYYAVLHLAKAALLSQGVRTSSHKGVLAMFGLHLVEKGLIGPDLARILAKEKEERELGDYDVMIDIDQERAKERIRQAEQFITTVKSFLSKGGL